MTDEVQKQKKVTKHGQWKPLDILIGVFGMASLVALAILGFKAAKWAMETYL